MRRAWPLLLPVPLAACADLWGFRDTPSSDGGEDGVVEAPADSSAPDEADRKDAPRDDPSSATESSSDSPADVPREACKTVTHSDGYGQDFTSCAPLGTYNLTEAMAACEAYASQGNLLDGAVVCVPYACSKAKTVELFNQACILWEYAGSAAGHTVEGDPCVCPSTSDTTWN